MLHCDVITFYIQTANISKHHKLKPHQSNIPNGLCSLSPKTSIKISNINVNVLKTQCHRDYVETPNAFVILIIVIVLKSQNAVVIGLP